MKILYAVHHLPPRYTGGAENRALRTARWIHSHGHSAAIISVEAIDQSEPAYVDSVYEKLPTRRLFFDYHTLAAGAAWEYDNPFIEQRIGEMLAEQRPDVFHLISGYLMTAGAIRAAHTAGVPIVITLTDFWFLCPRITLLRSDGRICPGPPADPLGCVRCLAEQQRRFRLLSQAMPRVATTVWNVIGARLPAFQAQAHVISARRQLLAEAFMHATWLICPSQFLRSEFIKNGFASERLLLMRQGLAIPPTLPSHCDRERAITIGYSGQIKPHKGVDLLIDAALALAARGYHFRVVVYGNESEDPRYAAELKHRTRQADWIEWHGTYEASQVWDVLAGLDAIVVPSRWYENSPNVILEAQAAQVPVIATRIGGMAELVRHDVDGLLFGVNDAQDLARQIARLLDQSGLIDRLRTGAPQVKTLDQEMNELLDLYQQLRQPAQAQTV
jgi:glycosyltransferase involved in cell wall biosynthesis